MMLLPNKQFIALLCALCVASDYILRIDAYVCEVGQERNEKKEWKWILPYDNLYACGCTKIIMGGVNTWTPIRPFKPVYVDSPLLADDINIIRRHYKLKCVNAELSSPLNNVEVPSGVRITTDAEVSSECITSSAGSTKIATRNAKFSGETQTASYKSSASTADPTRTASDLTSKSTADTGTTVGAIQSTTKSATVDSTTLKTGSCDENWKSFEDVCFYFNHTYNFSFEEAQEECKQLNASLASIHSQDEQNFIGDKTKLQVVENWWDSSYWIGMNDRKNKDQFEWIDGREKNYENWHPAEPNTKWNRNCVSIAPNENNMWHDDRCETKNAFICKKA